jgi:dynein heavy chain
MRGGISDGMCVIIENLGEEIDATLDPVLSRAIYKKGSSLYIKFGGEEMNYDPAFSLYMQTRLDNPHYKPEIAAQCTLINFIATERGLEDQLLAKTVGEERPDLEAETQRLNAEATQYKIQLLDLEDQLLERLANAPDDILSDIPLIEGLEATKKTSKEIQAALAEGAKVTAGISVAREVYRKQASEGAMLYFMLTRMCAVDHMYQYSLDSFVTFFLKSIAKATAAPKIEDRVANLVTSLRMTIFTWVARGLFTRHKLIFLSVITFGLMKRGTLGEDNLIDPVLFDFLLKGPKKASDENPLQSWLPRPAWEACQALADLDDFGKLPADLVEAAPRFREWYNHATPESEKLPLDWSQLDRPDKAFKKMLVVRSLRPDRMVSHLANFLRTTMPAGGDYVDCDSTLNSVQILRQSLADSTPQTPIYFILSPGADVVADLDKIAAEQDPPFVNGENYFNVSMGQGQDVIAMSYLESAHRNGSWVILNNIHLMPKWLLELEKKLDSFGDHSHDNFRLFLSSDPAKNIPIGILNRCIKLTNEPPGGLKANLVRAFCFFSKESFEELDSKTKSILFGLCHFHAVMMERKLYGPMGYNMMYPFAVGDLRDSAVILSNYMENSGGGKIPWMDLKYLFGEIMYGGHIVNDFDRLTCKVYLDFFMKDELLDETEMYPYSEEEKGVSFMCPAPTSYDNYLKHINATLTSDTPVAFGLHPNAEIDFRTTQSEGMFKTLVELQPRSAGDDEGGGMSPTEVAAAKLDDIMERFGEKKFDIDDLDASLDEKGPFQNSFLQEMEVMNRLLAEIVRSLKELTLGFKGELSMSDAMEAVCDALFMDEVPPKWGKISWASMKALSGWLTNFTARLGQLEEWAGNPTEIPKCTWLSYLINPQSFLTSVNQVAAQKNQWELDKLVTFTDVTKWETHDKVDSVSRDGAYVCGFNMQGARWDTGASTIDRSKPKEMFFGMPVLSIRGLSAEKADFGNMYMCPVYKTEFRGPTFVFCANLKTKSAAGRWTLAGVALIMELTA